MMVPLSPLVMAVVGRHYSVSDQAVIASLLAEQCGYNLPLVRDAAHIERIRLAVLKLASGEPDAILDQVVVAQRDWRDVLVSAGFGNDLTAHLRWAADPTA